MFYIAKNSTLRVPADLSVPGRLEQSHAQIRLNPAIELTDLSTRAQHFDNMLERSLRLVFRVEDLLLQPLIDHASDNIRIEELPNHDVVKELADVKRFLLFDVFSFMKAFDADKSEGDTENFYMEREWRIAGNATFPLNDVSRVLLPETYSKRFRQEFPQCHGQFSFVDHRD